MNLYNLCKSDYLSHNPPFKSQTACTWSEKLFLISILSFANMKHGCLDRLWYGIKEMNCFDRGCVQFITHSFSEFMNHWLCAGIFILWWHITASMTEKWWYFGLISPPLWTMTHYNTIIHLSSCNDKITSKICYVMTLTSNCIWKLMFMFF